MHGLSNTGLCALVAIVALAGCGGDDSPDADGDLTPMELAAKVPAADASSVAAVDVAAAKEAADQPADADPIELGTSPQELRLGSSAYYGLRSLSALVENPVRDAFDNSLITGYAGHPYLADGAVTLVSTSQPYEEIADALEEAGWEGDGDVLTSDGDPEEVTYTAIAPGDGFIALGYDADVVQAVAEGDAEPSDTGELELLEDLDAPSIYALIPDTDGSECIDSVTFEDSVDGTALVSVNTQNADEKKLLDFSSDAESVGFELGSVSAQEDAIEIELQGSEDEGSTVVNTPALLVFLLTDADGKLIYDCG